MTSEKAEQDEGARPGWPCHGRRWCIFLGGNKKTPAFAEGGREARVCPPTLEEAKNIVNTTYIIAATYERARKKAAGC
jgi:hypothetical protein